MAVRIEIRQSGASQIIRTKNAYINDLLCGIVHRADEHLLFEAVEESYLNSDLTMYISEWRQINLEEFFFFFPDSCKRLPCMPSAIGPELKPIAHTHISEISGDAQDNHRFDLARGRSLQDSLQGFNVTQHGSSCWSGICSSNSIVTRIMRGVRSYCHYL